MKFKRDDIIAHSHTLAGDHIMVAMVIGQREFEYHLLYLDGSSGWHEVGYVDEDYKELGWNAEFFKLFMINEMEI